MSDIVKTDKGGVLSVLHGGGGITLPKPFEREIFLFDTYIAGTTHIDGIKEIYPQLEIDERLDFFREPDNAYDEKAIIVGIAGKMQLGYVPQADNAIFSRLMDAGKLLFGKISSKEIKGNWVKIKIKVYLKD